MFQEFSHEGYQSRVWSCGLPSQFESTASDVYLSAYGQVTCNGNFRLEQVHTLTAFHLFDEGHGTFELDGEAHEITSGDLVIVRPGVHARYYDRPEDPWRYRWFAMAGTQIEQILSGAGIRDWVLNLGHSDVFTDTFQVIESRYSAETVSGVQAISLGWRLLAALTTATKKTVPEANPLAERAELIMQQGFSQGLQVEDICRQLGVSRATLFRRFRDAFGISPKAYLDNVRLTQADKLLKLSRSSIKEVAAACGYHCSHYFSNAYKKRYGVAPSDART